MGSDHAGKVPLLSVPVVRSISPSYLDFEFQLGVDGVHHLCPLHLAGALVAQTDELQTREGLSRAVASRLQHSLLLPWEGSAGPQPPAGAWSPQPGVSRATGTGAGTGDRDWGQGRDQGWPRSSHIPSPQ